MVIGPKVTQERRVEPAKRRITGLQFSSPLDCTCCAAAGQMLGSGGR